MGFGGKVHDPEWAVLAEDGIHAVPVTDVAFRKRKAGILRDRFQAAQVAGIREFVQHHHSEFGLRQGQPDKVASYESRTTRDQNRVHASKSFRLLFGTALAPMRALVQELVPEPGKISAKIVPDFARESLVV